MDEMEQGAAAPEARQCAAITHAGTRCHNRALPGQEYCAVHQQMMEARAAATEAAAEEAAQQPMEPMEESTASTEAAEMSAALTGEALAAAEAERARMQSVAADLNRVAAEIAARDKSFRAPPYSPDALAALLRNSKDRLAAFLPTDFVKEVVHNLEGTKPEDLADPETWKGLWYILTYTLQLRTKEAIEAVGKRLSFIPGIDLMTQFSASVVESPRDLLDVNTWKGGLVVLNAAVQAQLDSAKRMVKGQPADE